MIDLRSDTVTLPTPAMLRAISEAKLGDDVFVEDPTTIALEQRMAETVGMEAGLLVASGTMGNLVSVMTHCARGEEVILGDQAHTFLYEAGGIAALGGIHPRPLNNQPDGTLMLADIEGAIRHEDVHFPRTRLICLENTHNRCGGCVLTPDYLQQVIELAGRHQLKLHLDGARLFNASVALEADVKELTRGFDSLSVCLSKGLSAPVGSVICGTQEFINEARRTRKLVGGGMRQCGIIAASGLVALDEMVERLAEDHTNAKTLAQGLAGIKGIVIDPDKIQTNIVFFKLKNDQPTAQDLMARLKEQGILILALGPQTMRAVTHYGISAKDIDKTLKTIDSLF